MACALGDPGPGTRTRGPGPGDPDPRTRTRGPGPADPDPGTRTRAQGPGPGDLHGPGDPDPGTRTRGPGPGVEGSNRCWRDFYENPKEKLRKTEVSAVVCVAVCQ